MTPFILHIDETFDLPSGAAEALEAEGYVLQHTADPEEAMRLVEERKPALVVMEIELSGWQGMDLMAGIRDPQFGSVPVLVVTHEPRDSAIHGEAIALGVADFLTKPVRRDDLLAAIHEVLPAPRAPAAATPSVAPDLSGDLADTPMPELLARLRRRGASGVLAVGNAGIRVGVQLRNGSPVGIASSRREPVAEAALYETFRWEQGRYAFSEKRQLESDALLELAGDPAGLLLAGVLDGSPARQVHERLAKRESLYVSTTGESEAALESEGVGFTGSQRRLLEGLAGGDTLSVLLESGAFDEKLVYALWVGGWLELQTAPTLTLTELLGDTKDLEPELEYPEPWQGGAREQLEELEQAREELAREREEREREREELARERAERGRELRALARAREEHARELEELAPELDERAQELEALARKREQRSQELNELAHARQEREQELEELERTREEHARELEDMAQARAERARELEELTPELDERAQELEVLARKREERAEELETLARKRERRARELKVLGRARAEREQEVEALAQAREEHSRELEELSRARADRARELEELTPELDERAQELEQLGKAREERAKELEELSRKREERAQELEKLGRTREEREQELEELAQARDERAQELEELVQAREEQSRELEELREARAERERELEELAQARTERARELEELTRAREERAQELEALAAQPPGPEPELDPVGPDLDHDSVPDLETDEPDIDDEPEPEAESDELDLDVEPPEPEAEIGTSAFAVTHPRVVSAPSDAVAERAEPAPKPIAAAPESKDGGLAVVGSDLSRRRVLDAEDIGQKLRDLAEHVLAGDDFQALGISADASDEEALTAYERILAEIPEIDASPANLVHAQRADRIRMRIEAAYGNLRDEERRRAYSLMREEEEQDRKAKPSAERALEGERWFRKGKGHLDRRAYGEAVEAFGMASHLDPDEGEYASHLGYALYLTNPNEASVQKEAMEHVARGIKRSPKSELSYVYLGRILKAKGEVDTARKIFQKALRIKPDFHPAVQELRVLEMRERKGKGVLSRLMGR